MSMAGSTVGLHLSKSAESLHRRHTNSARSIDQLSNATWMTRDGQHNMGKGQRLFTGPGGVRDYQAHVVTDDRMVGIGTMSPEGTSELRYIWRGATGTPSPKPRSKWVGEIGWFMPFTDVQNMRTGHQINLATFRQAQEDKYTHRFQEPWYPSPSHPNYTQSFPFTKGRPMSTVFQNTSQPSYAQSKHVKRPHTVASFNSTDSARVTPNSNNSAQTLSYSGYNSRGSTQSLQRPSSGQSHISAVSVHSRDNSYFNRPQQSSAPGTGTTTPHSDHPPSLYLSNTSLGQRPLSGSSSRSVPASPSHYMGSRDSVGSSHSTHKSRSRSHGSSRQSSGRSTASRRSIVPASTSIYRPPVKPDY